MKPYKSPMTEITDCHKKDKKIHPPQNMKTHTYDLANYLVSLSFIDKTLTTVEKKFMIHDPEWNIGDEQCKAGGNQEIIG